MDGPAVGDSDGMMWVVVVLFLFGVIVGCLYLYLLWREIVSQQALPAGSTATFNKVNTVRCGANPLNVTVEGLQRHPDDTMSWACPVAVPFHSCAVTKREKIHPVREAFRRQCSD